MKPKFFCQTWQVVWGLVGAKVRLPRPTNCANAPRWFSSLFLLCEEEFFDHGLDVVEAEGSLPNLAGGWGLLGRKYAYLVLPTVLMPRGGFPHCFYSVRKSFSSKRGRSSSFLEREVRERREPGGIF